MKVLILSGSGAMKFIRFSYARAMQRAGFFCSILEEESGTPIFDVFDEFEPEVVMCGSWQITRALFKNLMKRPHIKLILWGSNWGSFDKEIDSKTDPVLMATDQEKKYVQQLKDNNNIQYIFSYYHQRWADVTHDKWQEVGLKPIGLPLAADLLEYQPGTIDETLECDLSFVGGYWPYKAKNINRFLLPLCRLENNLKIKIFGWGDWSVAQHMGSIAVSQIPNLFASSIINANIFEPLAQKYGFDVNERCYKVLACGGFCVSEYCESAEKDIFTDGEVIFAKTPEEFYELVKYFIRHPDERLAHIEMGLQTVRKKHNYFLRLRKIMELTGINTPKLLELLDEEIKQTYDKRNCVQPG